MKKKESKRTVMDFQPSPRKTLEFHELHEPIVMRFTVPPDNEHPEARTFHINGTYHGEIYDPKQSQVSLLKFNLEERSRCRQGIVPAGIYAKRDQFEFLKPN